MTHPLEQELLQHGKSLRLLARSLVGDQHADDLVQETTLQALGAPSPPRSLRAFLRQILRHLAGKHHRGERHRRQRDAAVLPAEPPLPPDWIAAHRETLRRLDKALLALPEPVLGTVMLRFFEDLPPSAIAAKTGVPLPTVKSRLQRGLELLRESMGRDGDDWRGALSTAFGLRAAANAVATTTGVLLMGTGVKLALCGLAAALVVVASLQFAGGAPEAPPAAASDPRAALAATSNSEAKETAQNTSTVVTSPDRVTAPTPAPEPTRTAIRGRCTDLHGNPLAGCTVRLHDSRKPDSQSPEYVTGADGRFECTSEPTGEPAFYAFFRAEGMVPVGTAPFSLPRDATKDLGDIALQHGVHLSGRVLDTLGAPVAGLTVRLQWNGGSSTGLSYTTPRGTTGDDGSFDLGPWLAGTFELRVEPARLLSPRSVKVQDDADDQQIQVLVEARSRLPAIAGVVVDSRGAPLANARVRATSSVPRQPLDYETRTDDAGRFTFYQWDEGDGPAMQVRADCDGFEQGRTPAAVPWGSRDVQLALRDAMALEIEVVDDHGRPVEDFAVRMQVADDGRIQKVHAAFFEQHAGHHPGGRLRLEGVRRSTYEFYVQPQSERLASSPILHIDVDDPDPARLTVRLMPRTQRVLQLATTTGAPVAGCRVELCLPYRSEVTPTSWAVPIERWENYHGPQKSLLLLAGTTDGNGELLLQGPAGEPLCVRLLGPGCPPRVLSGVRLDDPAPLRCELPAGATLHVEALHAEVLADLATLKATESLSPRTAKLVPGLMLRRRVGDRFEWIPDLDHPALAFGADGTLTIPGVPAGRWRLSLRYAVGTTDRWLDFDPVDLVEDKVTELRLDFAPLRLATLRGTVSCDGRPAARQELWFQHKGQPNPDGRAVWQDYRVASGPDGSFLLRGLPGRYRLNVTVDNVSGALRAQPGELELPPGGAVEQSFALNTGSLRIRVIDSEGKPVAGVHDVRVQRGPADFLDANLPDTDAEGRASLAVCEAGTFHIWVLPRRLATHEALVKALDEDASIRAKTDIDLGSITVAAGAPTEQTVLLPAAYFQ